MIEHTAIIEEESRLHELYVYERELYAKGFTLIAGVDEVGRGPLAGPVVAGAVILPKECYIEGLNDSKKISSKKRKALSVEIKKKAVAYSVGLVDNKMIDKINILEATKVAMKRAVMSLSHKADYLLIDAITLDNMEIPQIGIIKGDSKSASIGAASIIAKVYRDELMEYYHGLYPRYGFNKHSGYPTKYHREAIHEVGFCPIHRLSFKVK